MPVPGMEWVALGHHIVVATPDRSWLCARSPAGPWARPMTGPGSAATTRMLLDGAARAGWAAARRSPEPPFSVPRWVRRLAGFYQTTHATPPLMREAAARFRAAGRASLADWAETKAREESGHDELVLRDLRALGYDAEATVAALVPAIPAALVAYFERHARAADPVGCVGYAYALERLALEVDEGYVARVEAALPAGVRATRCLRVHSASGSDRRHVEETVALVASLSAEERTAIARACYEAAVICYEPREGEALADESLERRLAPLVERSMQT